MTTQQTPQPKPLPDAPNPAAGGSWVRHPVTGALQRQAPAAAEPTTDTPE